MLEVVTAFKPSWDFGGIGHGLKEISRQEEEAGGGRGGGEGEHCQCQISHLATRDPRTIHLIGVEEYWQLLEPLLQPDEPQLRPVMTEELESLINADTKIKCVALSSARRARL